MAQEEYVRVSKKEVDELAFKLQKLKASVKTLEKSKAEVPDTVRKMINNTRPRNQNRGKSSQPELVSSFKEKLNNGRLRTDIEREKSNCTIALKKALPQQQKKMKDALKKVKERFEKGHDEISSGYEKELKSCFQNKNPLNSSLPVEQYACDELVRNYRNVLEGLLLPEMDKLYNSHCRKMDTSLKGWVEQYTTNIEQGNQRSEEVRRRLARINERVNKISQTTQKSSTDAENAIISLQSLAKQVDDFQAPVQVQEDPVEAAQGKVRAALEHQDYKLALKEALVACDLAILLWTCQQIPSVDDVFSEDPPSQDILLSLLHQLPSGDLHDDLELKSMFIQETIQAIDPHDDLIVEHRETVLAFLDTLFEKIEGCKPLVSTQVFNRNFRGLKWGASQLARTLDGK